MWIGFVGRRVVGGREGEGCSVRGIVERLVRWEVLFAIGVELGFRNLKRVGLDCGLVQWSCECATTFKRSFLRWGDSVFEMGIGCSSRWFAAHHFSQF